MVKKIGNIKNIVKRTALGIEVNIPPISRLGEMIADALCNPTYALKPLHMSN